MNAEKHKINGNGAPEQEYSCGAVVFMRADEGLKYLLVRSLSGEYGFPKGHVEPGETETETALREIREETDTEVKLISGFREETSFRLPQKNNVTKHITLFIGELKDQSPKPRTGEIRGVELLSFDDALNVLRHDDLRSILKKADFYIKEKLL